MTAAFVAIFSLVLLLVLPLGLLFKRGCSNSISSESSSLLSYLRSSEVGRSHVVVMSELLEHIWGESNRTAALAAAATRLHQGGMLLISTLNRTPENYIASILLAEHILGIIPKVRLFS